MKAEDLNEVLSHVVDNIALVPMKKQLYQELLDYNDGVDVVAGLVEFQMEFFLERMSEEVASKPESKLRGVVWGRVILPHGTELQTKYKGDWKQAVVQDGKVIWGGKLFDSVSKACNAMRGDIANNAWREMEVKLPSDSSFRSANRLRR